MTRAIGALVFVLKNSDMRFPTSDPRFALLRFSDGRPIKIEAAEANQLPDSVYEFDEVLFNLLRGAYETGDSKTLARLWSAAHLHLSATASREARFCGDRGNA